jgi:mono/diheme cytochrome c family protein
MYRFAAAILLALGIAFVAYTQSSRPAASSSHAYYSKEQAARGKTAYAQNCSKCHLENLKGNCPGEDLSDPSQYICAARGNAPPLVGNSFVRRWLTVGDLYSVVRGSMPADNVNGLSAATNLDIVAYLLQANGLPAGGSDLKVDLASMKGMELSPRAQAASGNSTITDPVNELGVSEAYYTEAQANRGKVYFQAVCARCHTMQAGNLPISTGNSSSGAPYAVMDDASGRGWDWGTQHRLQLLTGEKAFVGAYSGISGRPQRWDTVANLYNKVRTTQPPDYIDGLSAQEYVDIVAYIIQQNGFPAGKEELANNLNQMRNMTLERGFKRLFNGKDFTGWGFLVGTNCSPRPTGCGQTVPGTTFKVEDGMIADSGTPHGYMYPLKKFGPNFTLRVEYRYDPWPGSESDDDYYGNSGYLLFITEHHVWPRTLEIQGRQSMEMTINAMDGHATFTWDDELRKKVKKPAGEWNSVEIVSKGNEVWSSLNGTLLSHVSAHDFPSSGYIGIQSESGTMHYRNMRIKPE